MSVEEQAVVDDGFDSSIYDVPYSPPPADSPQHTKGNDKKKISNINNIWGKPPNKPSKRQQIKGRKKTPLKAYGRNHKKSTVKNSTVFSHRHSAVLVPVAANLGITEEELLEMNEDQVRLAFKNTDTGRFVDDTGNQIMEFEAIQALKEERKLQKKKEMKQASKRKFLNFFFCGLLSSDVTDTD